MFLSKYGVARHIYIAIPKAGSANHAVSADWTPSAGDVKIKKDTGAAANVTNLPSAVAMGNSTVWDFSLTATEMQAAQIIVTISDSATKAVDDTGFIIETYGDASAQHAFDLGTVTVTLPAAERNSIADAFLNRNIGGGSSAGRLVKDALRFLRNKWSISGGTLTVKEEDDTTTAWTATVSTDAAAVPIVGNDPS